MRVDITRYVAALRQDLAAAAEAGGEQARASAERLALALEPAVRMALFEALSDAAAEITQALRAGSVEVRLKGREPQFVVDVPAPPPIPDATASSEDDADSDEDGTIARITLRLPESLKTRAEEAAGRRELSLNTWLVQAVRAAARDRVFDVDVDLSSFPMGLPPPGRRNPGTRFTGWAR